jgi:hypothetical protein
MEVYTTIEVYITMEVYMTMEVYTTIEVSDWLLFNAKPAICQLYHA